MSRCKRCGVFILDESMVCPLCHGVLPQEAGSEVKVSRSVMYPDLMPEIKRLRFIFKLVVFLSVLLEILLVIINYATYKGVKWSAICGVGLAYACFVVYNSCRSRSEHRAKLSISFLFTVAALILIDNILGYSGWSLNLFYPILIMAVDLLVFILMLANKTYWQSYIMMQLLMLAACLVGMALALFDIINRPLLMIVATGITGVIFAGTILFGDRKATTELFRKFRM